MSTLSPYLNMVLMVPGEQPNTWGNTLNANFNLIDTNLSTKNTSINTLVSQMASTGSPVVASGLQTQITTLYTMLMSSGNPPVASGLQTQLTTLNNIVQSTAAAPVTSGLQTQITNVNTAATNANNTANAANSTAGTANATANSALSTANTANSTANAANSAVSALTSRVAALEATVNSATIGNTNLANRINALAALPVQAQIRTQHVAAGTMTGDWVIMRQAPTDGSANAVEIAFGRGEAKEGDNIVLPTGFSSFYAEAAMLNTAGGGDLQNFVVTVTGLNIATCRSNLASGGPNICICSWWAFAWRSGIT